MDPGALPDFAPYAGGAFGAALLLALYRLERYAGKIAADVRVLVAFERARSGKAAPDENGD